MIQEVKKERNCIKMCIIIVLIVFLCHSDKFFQLKIKHFSYYKTGDFTIYDFNYKKVRKAKNANILI